MRRDELRLRDMLEHIDSALLAVKDKARLDFDADPTLQKAVQYDLLTMIKKICWTDEVCQ